MRVAEGGVSAMRIKTLRIALDKLENSCYNTYMEKQKTFWWHYPGMIYANNWYAPTMEKARGEIRKELGMKRLPNGFSIWENKNETGQGREA